METKEHMGELHAENVKWINSMKFYEDEIKVFTKRLEELVLVNTNHDLLAEVEHFQNQFIRQREVIDELKHEFRLEEQTFVDDVKTNPVAADHRLFPYHAEMRDRYETFEKIYLDLKKDFEHFVSKSL